MIHTVKGFGIVNKAEIDVFLEFSCLFNFFFFFFSSERSYPMSEARGGGRECQAATAQEQPRGATPNPRSGAVAGRSYPASKELWLCREGQLLHVQGQEGWQ